MSRSTAIPLALLGAITLALSAAGSDPIAKSSAAQSDSAAGPLAKRYGEDARRIIDAVMAGNEAWKKMHELCDGIGHRLSGSESLERAIAWAAASMKADGGENVRLEKVMVPKWVRGNESASMLEPKFKRMGMLGLGGSVGTPQGGITAEVVTVRDRRRLLIHRTVITPLLLVVCLGAVGATGSIAYPSIERPQTYERIQRIPRAAIDLIVGKSPAGRSTIASVSIESEVPGRFITTP